MTQGDSVGVEGLAFGEAMSELEAIVAQLESGQLELEDSLERYERGVALLRSLQTRLSEAQQRVTVLMGELDVEPLDEAEGE
jgi:exodeoxyribonuclease VII small subunit